MRVLIIGGTRFVGWHITAEALRAGHHVTLLHRGKTGPDTFSEAEHLLADRDGDLAVLAGREWDATIDVSAYLPSQVIRLAEALVPRAGRYVFISTMSVYAAPAEPGFTEASPLLPIPDPLPERVTGETYGPLKVACEQAARREFGAATVVVRPTYVIGPRDYTGRFDYWVRRIARGGEVLAPGDPAAPIQVIDARDLAAFVVGLLERDGGETFHTVSPPPPFGFGELLAAIAAEVGPPDTTLTWVGEDFLRSAGIDGRSLPLWKPDDPTTSINAASPAAAYAAGLTPRPLRRSVRDIHGELASRVEPLPADAFLAPEREAEILQRWRQAS
jgi:2'-hydroxyisoflavone reductase